MLPFLVGVACASLGASVGFLPAAILHSGADADQRDAEWWGDQ
jgi:hypothetical protein